MKCSSTPDGASEGDKNSKAMAEDAQCNKNEGNIKVNKSVMSFETEEEALRPKGVPTPSPPSRQERLEHELTHLPFRSWCELCVKGKCKADQHRATGQLAESEIPVVSVDYAFMSDRGKPTDSGEEVKEEDQEEEVMDH